MSGPLRPPSRPGLAVAVLKTLGNRLTQPERTPYEAPDHDVEVSFDDPTGDQIPRDLTRDLTRATRATATRGAAGPSDSSDPSEKKTS